MSESTAKPALLTRLASAVVYAVTGKTPGWFGPGEPMRPQAPAEVAGRQTDYAPSTNLQQRARADEDITAAQLRNLAENCDVMRLVIQTRKDQLTAQKWQFQMVDKTARKRPDPRLQMLTDFFNSPDKEHSWEEWIGALVDDLLVIDAATVFPRRTPLPPAPAYQQILHGLSAVNYSRDELLYMPRNLRTYKLYGMSPVQQVAMTVNIALRRAMHQLEYYTSGTVPDALAGVPESWTPEQIGDYQRYFDELLTDDLAARRRIRFVPSAAAKAFVQTKEAALKDDFDEWLARIVCYAFSVSPQWAVKQMNRATGETAEGMANKEGLQPLMTWVARLVNRCIKLGWGWDDIEFGWHEEQETNPQAQMEVSTGYLKVGALTINQVLADIGRDPIPGGDVNLIYTPTGAVPLSIVLAPPPPPPAIGHNGGPALDEEQPDEADAQEALLKAADLETRLTAAWAHFFKQAAAGVAEIVAAAVPAPVAKAAGDTPPEEDETLPPLPPHPDAVAAEEEAARIAAAVPAPVEAAIDRAIAAMPWPAVQAATQDMLQTQALAAVKEGIAEARQLAGITVADAARRANPRAVLWAQENAAELVKGVSQTTRDALNRLVTQAQTEGWSTKQLIDRIVADHAFSEDRATLIARTELQRSAKAGQIESWSASARLSGLKFLKRVVLGMNENRCIACRSAVTEGAIPLEDSWTVGFSPPFHPACYCSMVASIDKSTPLQKAWRCDDGHGGGAL